MSPHRTYAACCFTSLLMIFLSSDAEASRWQLGLPTKPMDQVDPVSLVFAFDEIRQGAESMPAKFLSAMTGTDNQVMPFPVPTSTESQPSLWQTDQMMLSNIQVQYLHTDLLGSVVLETDSNGNVIKSSTYKPFGESGNN